MKLFNYSNLSSITTQFFLLEKLPEINFEVIFVTAYDHYGIKAIKFSALDYLLKPIDINELVSAVEKASEKIGLKQENQLIYHLLQNNKLSAKNKTLALSLTDKIEFIKSEGSYIRMKDGSYVSISRQRKEIVLKILTGSMLT